MWAIKHLESLLIAVCLFMLISCPGYADPGYRHFSSFGGNGQTEGRLNHPVGVAVDDAGNIHVTDFGNKRIQIFTLDGRVLRSFAVRPRLTRAKLGPVGLSVARDGSLFVVDQDHHQVKCFERSGKQRSGFGRQGSWRRRFRSPRGLALDRNDTIFVADCDNYRVQKFTPAGEYLGELRYKDIHTQRFARPWGLAVNRDGDVAVAYPEIRRVVLFNREGKVRGEFPRDGTVPVRLETPRYLAFDNLDRLYLSDYGSGRILQLDRELNFLGSFGQDGPSTDRLQQPEGLAVDYSGRVIVADAGTDRLHVFEPSEKVRHLNWAFLYRRQGRFERAAEEFELVNRMDPGETAWRMALLDMWVQQGQRLMRQGQKGKARNVFNRVREMDPLNAYAIRELKRLDALPVEGRRKQVRHLLVIFLLALGLALSFLMSFSDRKKTVVSVPTPVPAVEPSDEQDDE